MRLCDRAPSWSSRLYEELQLIPPSLTIVIPAFNEEARLGPTLVGALQHIRARRGRCEILVVDDGSRDRTADLVRQLAAGAPELRLIRLAGNHGKGYAVRTGMLNASTDLVLFADADGATPWGELRRLEVALELGADVAIGSRGLHARETVVRARLYRRVMGRAFHALVRVLTVKGIVDTQCGFKLFRGAVAQELFSRMRMDGFSFDVEVLLMARLMGRTIAEVPVNWTHQPGSKINLIRDSIRMARDLFVIRSHLLGGHYERPVVALPDTEVHS